MPDKESEEIYKEKTGQLCDILWLFYKKYGEEALKIEKEYFFNYGRKIGGRLRKEVGEDLTDFIPVLASYFAGGGLFTTEKPVVAERKRIKYRERGCPIMQICDAHGLKRDIMCDVFHQIDKGVADGAKLRLVCDQGLSRGKPCDTFTWEIP